MNTKIKNKVIIIISVILTACHSIRTVPAISYVQAEAKFPTSNIPLPVTDFKFLFPVAEKLNEHQSLHKQITEKFSSIDINELAIADPLLFSQGNTEIIDLSLIPHGDYAFPLPGAKVISPYGGRRKHHSGVDIKTCANDSILSAFDGIVRMAKPYAAYGNVIVVRHYNGLETIYSHNSKNIVKPGDIVKAGQPIALTGRTGRATTEHLHFEVRINGKHFNPTIIFNFNTRKLNRKCLICTQSKNGIQVKSLDFLPHQHAGSYDRFADQSENKAITPDKTFHN